MRILFWFRQDLRLDDNTGLAEAERDAGGDVVPLYASEPEILSRPDIAASACAVERVSGVRYLQAP